MQGKMTKDLQQDLIEAALPPGKTYKEALQRASNCRDALWGFAGCDLDEDEKVGELETYCTRLCQGNKKAGVALAEEAMWNP